MAFRLFTNIGNEIENVFKAGIDGISGLWVSGLIDIASIGITLYITFYGYLVLAGKTQEPVKNLVWDLARYTFVIAILQNSASYMNMIYEAVNQLKAFLMGSNGNNPYDALDQKFTNLGIIFGKIWEATSGFDIGSYILALFQSIAVIPLVMGVTANCLGFIISELTTLALLATFPLFLFCYLWGWLKDMFSAWLQAIIGVLMFCLFLYLFGNIGYFIAGNALDSEDVVGWDSVLVLFVAGIITLYGVKVSIQLAASLSKVSINYSVPSVPSIERAKQGATKLLARMKK